MRRHVMSILGVALLGCTSLLIAQTPDSAEVMFEAARQMELIDGDLDAAIAQYAATVSRYPSRRTIVAQSLLRMGSGYEKLGQARAREVYEQVVREYADQTEVLALAREGLSRLTVESMPPSGTMMVRELMRSGERQPGDAQAIPGAAFAVTSDGEMFVYTDWTTGDLAIRNITTGEVRSFYGTDWTSDEFFEDPVLSPDDKRVAYMRYGNRNGETNRVEVDSIEGGNRETVYDFATSNTFTYDWSPDGETILLSSQADDRSVFLATLSLTDHTLQRLVTLDWGHPSRAQFSPDGRFIAYDSTKVGDSKKIYLISVDGAQERVLVDSPGQDDSPLWTRDGRFLLFRSSRSGQWDLYALGMKNGQPTGDEVLIKSNLGAATDLRGVTTARQLLVHELVGGRDIFIADKITTTAKTAEVRVFPKILTIENKSPSFAPDEQRLAYLAGRPGSGLTIRVTDLEGRILKDISLERRFSAVYPPPPRFSPDGTKLGLRVYDAGEARCSGSD